MDLGQADRLPKTQHLKQRGLGLTPFVQLQTRLKARCRRITRMIPTGLLDNPFVRSRKMGYVR